MPVKSVLVLFQDLKDAQETFKQNMPAAEEEFRSILALGKEVSDLAKGAENPYTLVTTSVCIDSVHFLMSEATGLTI